MSLDSVEDLRTIYRQPRVGPVEKVIHRIDPHCVDFLAKSPLLIMSTADANGVCDASPKGGPPGFVEALDEQRVAWADYSGNNRLDSFQNLVDNPHLGLLFLIPGLDETLRINGTAELSVDPDLCQRFAVNGKPARVVVVVTVAEAYLHCAKALRRAEVWSPESWLEPAQVPSAPVIYRDHIGLDPDTDIATMKQAQDRDLHRTLWEPGGSTADPRSDGGAGSDSHSGAEKG